MCYLGILSVQYTYIPGKPRVEFGELKPVTGWDWCLAHNKCLRNKCVLAGVISSFLPSTSPRPGSPPSCPCSHLVSAPCSRKVWSGPASCPRGRPEPAAWGLWPGSAYTALCILGAFTALTIPASSQSWILEALPALQALDTFQSLLWTCLSPAPNTWISLPSCRLWLHEQLWQSWWEQLFCPLRFLLPIPLVISSLRGWGNQGRDGCE